MPSPICVPCKQEMVCEKNEFSVCDPARGHFPSTYWVGTQWKCPTCEASVVANFGERPIASPGVTARELVAALEFQHS